MFQQFHNFVNFWGGEQLFVRSLAQGLSNDILYNLSQRERCAHACLHTHMEELIHADTLMLARTLATEWRECRNMILLLRSVHNYSPVLISLTISFVILDNFLAVVRTIYIHRDDRKYCT